MVLRLGGAACFVLLFALPAAESALVFPYHPGRRWPLVLLSIGALLVTLGAWTRTSAALVALAWAWALYSGLHLGQGWFALPVRDVEFLILFAALALTGPGKYSIQRS